jgi:hypothetical protein
MAQCSPIVIRPVLVWTTANGLIRVPLPILIRGESCTMALGLTPQPNLTE